jgi:hypothetical protein
VHKLSTIVAVVEQARGQSFTCSSEYGMQGKQEKLPHSVVRRGVAVTFAGVKASDTTGCKGVLCPGEDGMMGLQVLDGDDGWTCGVSCGEDRRDGMADCKSWHLGGASNAWCDPPDSDVWAMGLLVVYIVIRCIEAVAEGRQDGQNKLVLKVCPVR